MQDDQGKNESRSQVRENLVGYLLGALEPAEQQAVERELAQDESLCRELSLFKSRLELMDTDDDFIHPPKDLVSNTLASIVAFEDEHKVQPASISLRSDSAVSRGVSGWSLTDLIVAAGICVAAAMLFFPAIANSRNQARIAACQHNLQSIGRALHSYSEFNQGYFPPLPNEGKMAVAGYYAVVLRDQEFITDPRQFVCPSSSVNVQPNWTLPTREQIESATGPKLIVMQQSMGGSYGYTLGYLVNGQYHPTRNLQRPSYVIMADSPNPYAPASGSLNHGGRGQNVLFEDLHFQYIVERDQDGCWDYVYVNRQGEPAAGVDMHDSVVGSSATSPVVFNRR